MKFHIASKYGAQPEIVTASIRSRVAVAPLVTVILSASLLASPSMAQGSWPGCPDVAAADFRLTSLVTRAGDQIQEPIKIAFEPVAAPGEDMRGKVHVYFTERMGRLRKFDALLNRTVNVGQITGMTIGTSSSDGLMGIALDPGFRSNHHLFLYYTAGSGSSATWRVSRFTLNAAHDQLVTGTEKVILDIPITLGAQHPGGALQFDAYGDLWITTGDNNLPGGTGFNVHTAANTNDLRGKILRIRPKPDGSGYDVPEGNLFAKGTAKTRPEIYVMGGRNPYTLTLDPVRRWAAWGDVGPDNLDMDGKAINGQGATELTEEYNLTRAPGNHGYPFFVGGNFALKSGINPASPQIPAGTSWNGAAEGLMTLPAAIPAIKPYKKACAVTGPIYRYDGDLVSSIKFPPHFHRKWFVTDFNTNIITLLTLNADGSAVTGEQALFSNLRPNNPLDMQMGPDGALYIVNYAGYRSVTSGTGIVRIEYTGTCRPAEPKLEQPTRLAGDRGGVARGEGPQIAVLPGREPSVEVKAAGDFRLEVSDLQGRPLAAHRGRGEARFFLPGMRGPGIYLLVVTGSEGRGVRKIVVE